jgi:hypothetical protein
MTFADLQLLIETHKIPKNVRLQSDSGWECSETDMNGVWYNRKTNTIIFTQGNHMERDAYYDRENWVMLRGCLDGMFKEKKQCDVISNEENLIDKEIIVKDPGDIRAIEGYSGAFCKCGHVLHIKTPKIKGWYPIKCPVCGFVANLFCGEEGEKLGMEGLR